MQIYSTLPDVINDLFNRNYALLLNCYFDKPIKPDVFFIEETEDKKYQVSKEIALKKFICNAIVIEHLSKNPSVCSVSPVVVLLAVR